MAEILKPVPGEELRTTEKNSDLVTSSSAAYVPDHNPALDRKLLWKRDLVLVPIMGVLYSEYFHFNRLHVHNITTTSNRRCVDRLSISVLSHANISDSVNQLLIIYKIVLLFLDRTNIANVSYLYYP